MAKLAGVSPATIRRWCDRGLYADRTRGGHRRFVPLFLHAFFSTHCPDKVVDLQALYSGPPAASTPTPATEA